jgi:hypothetical protein
VVRWIVGEIVGEMRTSRVRRPWRCEVGVGERRESGRIVRGG